jgi:hypothetical protein
LRRLAVLLASIACLLLVASAARAGTCALPPEAGPVSAYEGTIRRALHTGEAVHVVLDCTPQAAGRCGALNRELNGYLQCRLGEARRAAAQPTATGRPSDPSSTGTAPRPVLGASDPSSTGTAPRPVLGASDPSHTGPEHRPVLGAGPWFELPPAPLTGSGPIPSGPEAAVLMPGAGDDPDQLPFTGSDGLLLVAGGLLLVVGGTLLVAARRLPPG